MDQVHSRAAPLGIRTIRESFDATVATACHFRQRPLVVKRKANASTMNPIYRFDLKVPAEVVDGNGHVNNVAYVQWMQDAAISHSRASGCTRATEAIGATWVARTHHVEYLRPAFAGDT